MLNIGYLCIVVQVRDTAWFVCLYGEIIPKLKRGDKSTVQGHKTMLYLTCTMISSIDLAHYGVSRAKDWVSMDYFTIIIKSVSAFTFGDKIGCCCCIVVLRPR